jgi:hypothetical protein
MHTIQARPHPGDVVADHPAQAPQAWPPLEAAGPQHLSRRAVGCCWWRPALLRRFRTCGVLQHHKAVVSFAQPKTTTKRMAPLQTQHPACRFARLCSLHGCCCCMCASGCCPQAVNPPNASKAKTGSREPAETAEPTLPPFVAVSQPLR